MIYKVLDPAKPKPYLEDKVRLLSQIHHRGIIAPQEVLYDKKSDVIGYSMPYVKGEVMVRYFTSDFRKQQKFAEKETRQVVEAMKDINEAAHAAAALIIDGNEMNYLINDKGDVSIIDVDSWQIGQYKANAIMASIRDYHSQNFSELTDWFSWAVVSFQLFTGIHPYKGRHPTYKSGSFVERMKDNVSIFNKDVVVPTAARPLTDIPANLCAWYEAAFEKGERTLPPGNFDSLVKQKIVQKTVYKPGGQLRFTRLLDFKEEVLRIFPNGAILTKDRLFVRGDTFGIMLAGHDVKHCVNTEVGVIVSNDIGDSVFTVRPDHQEIKVPVSFRQLFSSGNRLFAVTDDGITELLFRKYEKVLCLPGSTWALNPNSTQFHEGVAVYDAIGTPFVVLPIDEDGCFIDNRADHLKDKVLISAKAIDKFVVCLVKDRSGNNFKIELVYANDMNIRSWVAPTDENDLNFTMNSRGIVATIIEDGELILFSPKTGQSKTISDKHVKTDMRLVRYNGDIAFYKDNELWSLSTT